VSVIFYSGRGGAAGVNHVPLTGAEPNFVVAFNCNGNMVDLAGDVSFAGQSLGYIANGSYDGLRDVVTLPNGGSVLISTAGTTHRLPISSPISYGGFFKFNLIQVTVPHFIYCGDNVDSPTNYGAAVNSNLIQRVNAGPTFNEFAPRDAWFHFCITEPANRTSSKLYINGALVSTVTSSTPGTSSGTEDFCIGTRYNRTNTSTGGQCESIFVADVELDADTVRTIAENAFGHPLP